MANEMNFFDEPPDDDEYLREASRRKIVPFKQPKAKKQTPEGLEWQEQWHRSDSGAPLTNHFNAVHTLRNHDALKDIIRHDEMAHATILAGAIPGAEEQWTKARPITDADILFIQEAVQSCGLRRIAKETMRDAIAARAVEKRFHPVRDYLVRLQWDGKPRIGTWLSYYLGVEASDYASAIGKMFLIALVARVMRPGCKVDYMLILEGPQGAMKSTACRILAGEEHFSDNLPDLSRGDAVRLSMHLRGKWLVEIAELSSFNKAETHTLKEFITQAVERYTPKYGREEVREPRQCVFVGTTNESVYLRDPTGARRFWPVTVSTIDLEALAQDRDQLLAEAMHEFRAGAQWWPDREFEAEHIAPQQEARYEADPWQEAIETYLRRVQPDRITAIEILREAICIELPRIGTPEQRRVKTIMQALGWGQKKTETSRFYVRPQNANPLF